MYGKGCPRLSSTTADYTVSKPKLRRRHITVYQAFPPAYDILFSRENLWFAAMLHFWVTMLCLNCVTDSKHLSSHNAVAGERVLRFSFLYTPLKCFCVRGLHETYFPQKQKTHDLLYGQVLRTTADLAPCMDLCPDAERIVFHQQYSLHST